MATSTFRASALPCTKFNRDTCENEDSCHYSHFPDSFSLGSGGRNVCLGYLIGRCDGWSCYYSHNRADLLWADEEMRIAIQERLTLIDMWNGRMARIPVASLFPSLAAGISYPQPVPSLTVGYQGEQAYPTPYTSNPSPPESTGDSNIDAMILREEEEEATTETAESVVTHQLNPDVMILQEEEEPTTETAESVVTHQLSPDIMILQEEEEPTTETAESVVTHRLNPTAAVFVPRELEYAATYVAVNEVVNKGSAEIEDQPDQLDWSVPPATATKQDLEQWSSPQPGNVQESWDNRIAGDDTGPLWDTTNVPNSSKQRSAEKKSWDKQTTKEQKKDTSWGWEEPNAAAEAKWFGGSNEADLWEPTKQDPPPKPSISSVINSQKPQRVKGGAEKKFANSKKRSSQPPSTTAGPPLPKYANSKLKGGSTKAVATWAESDSPRSFKTTKEQPPHPKVNGSDEEIRKSGYRIPLTPGTLTPDPALAEEILKAHEKLRQENLSAVASTHATPSPAEESLEDDPEMKWIKGQGPNFDSTPDPPRDFASRSKGYASTNSWVPGKPSRWPSLKQ